MAAGAGTLWNPLTSLPVGKLGSMMGMQSSSCVGGSDAQQPWI